MLFRRLMLAPKARLGRLSVVMVAVLLLGMLPTVGLLWWVAQAGREDEKRETLFRLTQSAQFAAGLQADAIATIRHSLKMIGDQPLTWADQEQGCFERARDLQVWHPFMASLGVLRQDGTVICISHGQGHGLSLADRPYVAAVINGDGFTVGVPVVARTTGRVVMPMAMHVGGSSLGNPPAILGATLDLERIAESFIRVMDDTVRSADGRIKVYDNGGRLLATYPPRPNAPGEPPMNLALIPDPHGSFEFISADGRPRLMGYARAAQGATIYAAILDSDAMLSNAHQRFRTVLMFGLLAGMLGLAAALYIARVRILRPLAILTEVAARAGAKTPEHLATGRLPGEFDVLRLAMAGMLEDVACRERRLNEANVELLRLAERDALTGIANRRSFDSALAEAWAHALVESDHVALVILDVDFFKKFNDRYGHLPGDACLCKVAQAIDSVRLRERDMVARIGGEEFVMLLPRTDSAGALVVAERALDAIRDRMILHEDGVDGSVTASAGVAACVPVRGMDPLALLAAADAALYGAKQAGRNRVVAARSIGVSTPENADAR